MRKRLRKLKSALNYRVGTTRKRTLHELSKPVAPTKFLSNFVSSVHRFQFFHKMLSFLMRIRKQRLYSFNKVSDLFF